MTKDKQDREKEREYGRKNMRRRRELYPERVKEIDKKAQAKYQLKKQAKAPADASNLRKVRAGPVASVRKGVSSDYLRCRSHTARARASGSSGRFNENEWRELCRRHDNKCACCGEHKPLTADHVISLATGGTNTIDNIQPLCRSCNSRKGASTIDYRNGSLRDQPKQMSLFEE